MALGEAVIAALVGVPAYDWFLVNSAASRMVRFDYIYWPFTRSRMVSILMLSFAAFLTFLIIDQPEDGLSRLLPIFGVMAIHAWIAIAEIYRQRGQQ